MHTNDSDACEVLTDEYIKLMYDDAISLTSQSDELALRYYTCYLIAQNWESLNALHSREGVTYREPNPDKYLELYNKRIEVLRSSSEDYDFAKVSTNKNTTINNDGVMVRNDC